MSTVTSLIKFKKREKFHGQSSARRFHFCRRFRERVGYALSDSSYETLLDAVKTSGKFLWRRENEDGAVYGVMFNGARMKVVYDIFTNSLITVLPFK
jgi:hypothetical protein